MGVFVYLVPARLDTSKVKVDEIINLRANMRSVYASLVG